VEHRANCYKTVKCHCLASSVALHKIPPTTPITEIPSNSTTLLSYWARRRSNKCYEKQNESIVNKSQYCYDTSCWWTSTGCRTFFSRLLSSWGCNLCTSPICSTADRRTTSVDPVSSKDNKRSNLQHYTNWADIFMSLLSLKMIYRNRTTPCTLHTRNKITT